MPAPVTITEAELRSDFDAIMDRAASGEVFRIGRDDATAVMMLGIDAYLALTGKMRFTATIEQDENGAFIRLPDEVLTHLGWREGDNLVWTIIGDGCVSVRRMYTGEKPDAGMVSHPITP